MNQRNGTSQGSAAAERTIAADELPRSDRKHVTNGPPSGLVHPPTATLRTTVLPRRQRSAAEVPVEMPAQARFERVRQLGEGGIGEVDLAVDHDINRRVAMKRLRSERRDQHSLVRFAEEVRIVGQLEHPGIVPVHDVGVDEEGQHYLVMKYVEGENLEDVIRKLRDGDPSHLARFTYSHRLQLFAAMLEAIGYAHDKGIIHRDIKPANIMIGPYGEVTVMDWGIAKHVGDRGEDAPVELSRAATVQERLLQTQHGALVGTPLYMSPEQAAGRNDQLDARSDVFALGLVLCEFLLLWHPLEHKTAMNEILAELIAKGVDVGTVGERARRAGVPMELTHLVTTALEHEPSKRFSSVQHMLSSIRRIQDGQVAVRCHVTAFKRLAHEAIHWVDRHPFLYSTLLFATLLCTVAGLGFGVYRLVH